MAAVTDRHLHSASPLGYVSDGAGSSENDAPPPKERTQTFRTITRTPPPRCSTLGPESALQPSRSASQVDTTDSDDSKDEGEGESFAKTSNAAEDTEEGEANDDDSPADPADTSTLPTLANIGAALSSASSMISSHDTSFCNSLIVSLTERGGEVERLPSMDPRQSTAHKRSGSSVRADVGSDNAAAVLATAVRGETHGGDGNRESSENGDTIVSAAALPHEGLHIHHPDSVEAAATGASGKRPPSSKGDDESSSSHSPTSTGSARQRHHPASPAGDVRTLRDLMAWRSHLSDSQRSLDEHNQQHTEQDKISPMSKSVPTPPPQGRTAQATGGAAAVAAVFPASTPVTPGLWTPAPITRDHFHAPPSLPSLFDHSAASPLSVTAVPVSRHASRDDIASRCSNVSSLTAGHLTHDGAASHPHHGPGNANNANSSSSHHPPPQRLASNRFSKSDLGDSLPSSSSTSHITSPAVGVPPPHHHYPISSPYDSRPHIETEHGGYGDANHNTSSDHPNAVFAFPHSAVASPVLRSPVVTTARGAVVCDTRRAAQSPTEPHHACGPHDNTNKSPVTGVISTADEHQSPHCASPASSRSPHSTWGIEDYAPPHPRSVGVHHLPVLSPTRQPLPSRGSEPVTSPGSALTGAFPHGFAASQDTVHGSPISLYSASRMGVSGSGRDSSSAASPGGSPAGRALLHHRGPHSPALSTPCQPNSKAAKAWRGLQAPEEYPAFATPVDDDTNKAVVAFVTALLLIFCLGFIFAM